MRNYTHEELEAHCRKLWDTQWMNVVNHDNCYYGWDKGEAINHAVKMAEDYMRENFDAYAATLRQQTTNAPEIGSKLVGDGTVSDEAVGKLRSWIVSKTGMRIHPVELRAAIEAVAPLLRAPAEQGGRVDEGLFQRACEVVHHETDCPAIGGNGDADCRCDAVPFLRDLNTFLTKPTNEDAVDRAVDAFHDVYDGVSHNLRDAVRHVLATAALAQNAQGDEVARLKAVIERDRTAFCGLIARLKGELKSRAWLGDENARAAGGYTYDEPGFIREFGDACTAIMGALERAHRTFQDFTDCPSGEAIRNAQADAQAILDRHAERARVPDGWVLVPREPTKAMRQAGAAEAIKWPSTPDPACVWNAMLTAAPSQPEDAA